MKKEDSLALKGIAIILMVFHHCFRAEKLYESHIISFYPFSESFIVNLALMSKICVSIFAFISGYGLYISYARKKTTASRWALSRYVKTFSGFWFVYVLIAILSVFIKNRFARIYFVDGPYIGIVSVLLDFFGLAKLLNTGTLLGTWWYMSAAIVFILLTPVIYEAVSGKPFIILTLSLLLLRIILPQVGGEYPGNTSVYAFIPAFIGGMVFAGCGLFDKWMEFALWHRGRYGKALKCVIEIMVLCVITLLYFNLPLEKFWGFKFCITPILFILFFVEFIVPVPGLRSILTFLGKHSMNVFLIHNYIRTGAFGNLTYSCRHFILVVAFLLTASLLVSIVLEYAKKIVRYNTLRDKICCIIENH